MAVEMELAVHRRFRTLAEHGDMDTLLISLYTLAGYFVWATTFAA